MRRNPRASSVLLGLLSLAGLFPLLNYGQSYRPFKTEIAEIEQRALWKTGPLRFDPVLSFRDIGYDSNVYYTRETQQPISDYMAIFSPRLNSHLVYKNRLILSLAWNPEYVFYFNETRERRWNNVISPGFKLRLLRKAVLIGGYTYSNRRRRATSEFDVRANEKIQDFHGGFFYETGWRTSLGVTGSIRDISFEDITDPGQEIYLSRVLNREERNGKVEFYYRAFSRTTFFISGGYTEYNFKHEDYKWRNAYSFQVYSGLRFPLLGKIRGTLSLGYKDFVPRYGTKSGFSGLVGNTSLDIRLKRMSFRLNYSSDVNFSYYTTNIFFNEDRYGAGVSFYLTQFLRIDYNLSYGKSLYPEPMQQRLPDGSYQEITRKDRYLAHSAGLVFRVIGNTGIGLTINGWERDSNLLAVERARWFVGGYLTYEF